MNQRRETFSLTAIHESTYAAAISPTPKIRKSLAPTLKPNTSGESTAKIQNLLSTIQKTSESQIIESKNIKSSVGKLEISDSVKSALNSLSEHLIKKKRHFNSLHTEKLRLTKEIQCLSQQLSDVEEKGKMYLDNCQKFKLLKDVSDEINNKISQEKKQSENLRYMVNSRKDLLQEMHNPMQQAQKELKETFYMTKHIERLTESYGKASLVQRSDLQKAQDEANSQREELREKFNKELRSFQDRSKAVAVYKQSQNQWINKRAAAKKEENIKVLEELEKRFKYQEKLKVELASIQNELCVREVDINKALHATSTSSLEELGDRIHKLKESKMGLVKSQSELEENLSKEADKTQKLSSKLDAILVNKQVKGNSEFKSSYDMEKRISDKEKEIGYLVSNMEGAKRNSSAVVLSLTRLIQKLTEQSPTDINESISMLKDKIKELINEKQSS